MTRDGWVIVILSIQVTVMGLAISHLAYKLGYEQGRASVYASFAEDGTEGTCLVPTGCNEDRGYQVIKGHKRSVK